MCGFGAGHRQAYVKLEKGPAWPSCPQRLCMWQGTTFCGQLLLPSCPRLWGQVATSPHRSPVPLGATGLLHLSELLDALTQHQGGGTSWPSGVRQYPVSFLLRPGACCGHMGQGSRSGADQGAPVALPIPAPGWRPLASPTARSDPAARGRSPCPRPGLGPYDSLSLLSWPPAGGERESRPNMELFVLSEAQGHAGVLGVLGCPRESESLDTWGLRAHSPPNPVMGAYRPQAAG